MAVRLCLGQNQGISKLDHISDQRVSWKLEPEMRSQPGRAEHGFVGTHGDRAPALAWMSTDMPLWQNTAWSCLGMYIEIRS